MTKYNWSISKFVMKASKAEKDIQKKQAAFYDTMTQNYKQQFASQTAIQAALTAAFQPIVNAGPGQFGMTREEEAAQRTSARDATAVAYANAAKATRNVLAARGGGDMFLPSGTEAQIEATLAAEGAASESQKQTDITKYGYDIGRTNFFNAASILGGNAAQMNPIGYANPSISAGDSAFKSAQTVQQESGGFMKFLGGLAGGALQAGLGFVTGGASLPFTAAASSILGGSNNSNPGFDINAGGFCWVSAELYNGWDSPRAVEIRNWLTTSTDPEIQAFANFYRQYGQAWAEAIRTNPELRQITKELFDQLPYVRKVNNNANQ